MPESISILVNGRPITVPSGSTIAAALLQAGAVSRRSVSDGPRQPLCGMGICYECRASVDGRLHQKTCQLTCTPGMRVATE